MARVSLVDPEKRPDLSQLVARITGARRGRLINVYRLLLHTPAVADAWLALISSLRTSIDIDDRIQELAIMRVAILNRVDYILTVHVRHYAAKAGLTSAQIDTLADWASSPHFVDRDRAVLAYVDAMTRDVDVPDDVFDALGAYFNEAQRVGLTVLIGAYNMHSRVMQALRIDPEPPDGGQ